MGLNVDKNKIATSPAAGGAFNPGYSTGGSDTLQTSAKKRRLSEFKYGAPHETRRFNKKNEELERQANKNVMDRVAIGDFAAGIGTEQRDWSDKNIRPIERALSEDILRRLSGDQSGIRGDAQAGTARAFDRSAAGTARSNARYGITVDDPSLNRGLELNRTKAMIESGDMAARDDRDAALDQANRFYRSGQYIPGQATQGYIAGAGSIVDQQDFGTGQVLGEGLGEIDAQENFAKGLNSGGGEIRGSVVDGEPDGVVQMKTGDYVIPKRAVDFYGREFWEKIVAENGDGGGDVEEPEAEVESANGYARGGRVRNRMGGGFSGGRGFGINRPGGFFSGQRPMKGQSTPQQGGLAGQLTGKRQAVQQPAKRQAAPTGQPVDQQPKWTYAAGHGPSNAAPTGQPVAQQATSPYLGGYNPGTTKLTGQPVMTSKPVLMTGQPVAPPIAPQPTTGVSNPVVGAQPGTNFGGPVAPPDMNFPNQPNPMGTEDYAAAANPGFADGGQIGFGLDARGLDAIEWIREKLTGSKDQISRSLNIDANKQLRELDGESSGGENQDVKQDAPRTADDRPRTPDFLFEPRKPSDKVTASSSYADGGYVGYGLSDGIEQGYSRSPAPIMSAVRRGLAAGLGEARADEAHETNMANNREDRAYMREERDYQGKQRAKSEKAAAFGADVDSTIRRYAQTDGGDFTPITDLMQKYGMDDGSRLERNQDGATFTLKAKPGADGVAKVLKGNITLDEANQTGWTALQALKDPGAYLKVMGEKEQTMTVADGAKAIGKNRRSGKWEEIANNPKDPREAADKRGASLSRSTKEITDVLGKFYGGKMSAGGEWTLPPENQDAFNKAVFYGHEFERQTNGTDRALTAGEVATMASNRIVGEQSSRAANRKQAAKETEARAGYLSTDATDFASTGGNRKTFEENRARELDAQPGLGLGSEPTAPAAPAQPAKPKAPPLPKGFDQTMAFGVNTLLKGTPVDKFAERMRKMGYDDARINATIRFAEQVKSGQ